jgi:hypothetical protein
MVLGLTSDLSASGLLDLWQGLVLVGKQTGMADEPVAE